jgi:hypothetical protein
MIGTGENGISDSGCRRSTISARFAPASSASEIVKKMTDAGEGNPMFYSTTANATPNNDATPRPKTRGRAGRFPRNGVIKVTVSENPKKPFSKARAIFALYRDGMTVGEFLQKGGRRIDLDWDTRHEFISIS